MNFKKLDLMWLAAIAIISTVLILPATHDPFIANTKAHPYIMGFIKFAVLASMGELLAIRIVTGKWSWPLGAVWKVLSWGVIGMFIALSFEVYAPGVGAAIKRGMFPVGDGSYTPILIAFWMSTFINLSFGSVMMAAHRMSDTFIDLKAKGMKANLDTVIDEVDWKGFIKFVIFKTLPIFWIPAHTITFMLPPEYRVLMAAYLGIAMGCILAYARRKKSST